MPRLKVPFGTETAELAFIDGRLLQPRHGRPVPNAIGDVAASTRDALENPADFPSLRRALTPDDLVAITVPGTLHQLPAVLTAVIEPVRLPEIALRKYMSPSSRYNRALRERGGSSCGRESGVGL